MIALSIPPPPTKYSVQDGRLVDTDKLNGLSEVDKTSEKVPRYLLGKPAKEEILKGR